MLKNLEERPEDFVTEALIKSGHLKALLFATHKQLVLYRAYPDVLLLDCTYKTNRYDMPLLHFGFSTLSNTYFSTAFVFLSDEIKKDYNWALETFNELILKNLKRSDVVITDNSKALKNALLTKLPAIP